jgi:uncharacterized membrane protein
MLRSAGVIELRDEQALYARQRQALGAARSPSIVRWSGVGAIVSFKAVLLEGLEVVVIVIGIGAAGGSPVPAAVGAIAACVAVAAIAAAVHRPLSRVPENTLKFVVGIMVSAFGLFWFGEGSGLQWPHGDITILGLMAILLATSATTVGVARRALP